MREFKVGDKVSTRQGEGEIVCIDLRAAAPYLVDFGEGFKGHDGLDAYYKHPTETCLWMHESDLALVESETPEPLENWKHPYYGKPILVRNADTMAWNKKVFAAYVNNDPCPIFDTEGASWTYYKFPEDVEPIELTQEELLQIAAEAKGVAAEQIKIKNDE